MLFRGHTLRLQEHVEKCIDGVREGQLQSRLFERCFTFLVATLFREEGFELFLDFYQRSLRSAESDGQFRIRTAELRIRTARIGSSFSPRTSAASSSRHRERILPRAAWPSRNFPAASGPVSKDERQSPDRTVRLKSPHGLQVERLQPRE